MEKKRYWLKLQKDFLKSNHIKVIKNMPNGKDYIIFYLALLLESVETVGHLRFNDLVPYSLEMLSSITETNIDVVRSAVTIFEKLGLIQVFDDGTIFLTQVAQMTGKESESAERVRIFREKQSMKALQCNSEETNCNDNKEKEEEEEKQRTENNEQRTSESEEKKHKHGEHKNVLLTHTEHERLLSDYPNAQQAIDFFSSYIAEKPYKSKSHYLAIKRWVFNALKERNGKTFESKSFSDIAKEMSDRNEP